MDGRLNFDTEGAHQYDDQASPEPQTLSKPPYDQILDWMSVAESPSLLFDMWSRGNFVRHAFREKEKDEPPIVIPFTYLDELRCYYRRLSLLGLPATFIYVGELPEAQKHLSLWPGGDDFEVSGGAGWLTPAVAPQKMIRSRGRNWFLTTGFARPMPEVFAEWLLTEGRQSFARGALYIAPSELIGIPKSASDPGLSVLADIQDTTVIPPKIRGAEFLINLDLPFIDEMPTATFEKLIDDERLEIQRFRHAIKKLIRAEYENVDDAIAEVRHEVAEMTLSDGHSKFRHNISKFGGALTSFGMGLSAFNASSGASLAALKNLAPSAIGAATAGATAILIELWKQGLERRHNTHANPYSIFWDLGVKRPSQLERRKQLLRPKAINRSQPALLTENYHCHWLAKPGQMNWVFAKPR